MPRMYTLELPPSVGQIAVERRPVHPVAVAARTLEAQPIGDERLPEAEGRHECEVEDRQQYPGLDVGDAVAGLLPLRPALAGPTAETARRAAPGDHDEGKQEDRNREHERPPILGEESEKVHECPAV